MTRLTPSGVTETFSGVENSAWDPVNWVQTLNEGSGGGITIHTGRGQMLTGAIAGNRIAARVNFAARADAEAVFTWVVPTIGNPRFWFRAATNVDGSTGYYIFLKPTSMDFGVSTASNPTVLVTYTHGFAGGTLVRTRVAMFGNRFRARTWDAAGTEPTLTWQMDTTNSAITAAGAWGFNDFGSSNGSKDLLIDDFDIFDVLSPRALTAVGSIAPAGFFNKGVKKHFSGSITPTGTSVVIRVILKNFSGSITATGTLFKGVGRRFSGSITAAGTMKKTVGKHFSGSITPAAFFKKKIKRTFSGSITPAGTMTVLNVGRIFGKPGVVVMNVLRRARVAVRHRKG